MQAVITSTHTLPAKLVLLISSDPRHTQSTDKTASLPVRLGRRDGEAEMRLWCVLTAVAAIVFALITSNRAANVVTVRGYRQTTTTPALNSTTPKISQIINVRPRNPACPDGQKFLKGKCRVVIRNSAKPRR
ncbi:uncharacterized protein LOC126253137 isoform X2 [Schistocerca nitens]|uniref:uncharacterized protein LOC126253137 isoform X2 n=1 Tax=Schistocerca nitens TaxID=7011 RepID=UPI0021198246|nr:uncharacterized protein LOC126253137 isoform X2 [Schistocerca nitens]